MESKGGPCAHDSLIKDDSTRVVILVPCYNESATVADVVTQFQQSLPHAKVFVLDNASSDGTAQAAARAGARVLEVTERGKGNVVRRAFADIDADVYLLVDGDATYAASHASKLVDCLLRGGLDMVVGSRIDIEAAAYRAGHRFGNRLLTECVAWLFGRRFKDLLSGYRVFSRRYAKSFPAHAKGFEIETELTVHALQLRMPVAEIETPYRARPTGSQSKLHTYRDGLKIVATIVELLKAERPLLFFGAIAAMCAAVSIGLSLPLFSTYLQIGTVPRFPTAIACAGLMMIAAISLVAGIILDTVTRGRIEAKHLAYLSIASPGQHAGSDVCQPLKLSWEAARKVSR